MSFAKVHSAQISFLETRIVDIEVDLSRGLHSFSLVGLANKAVEEARDRISAAIKNSGFVSPKQKNQKIVVSLAPADIKKEGPHFDLGIALAYLKAAGDIAFSPEHRIFLGELSLDGEVRPIHGTVGLILEAVRRGYKEAYVPAENADEAALAENIAIYGVRTLSQLVGHLKKESLLQPHKKTARRDSASNHREEFGTHIEIDFSDIHGQESAKRALMIAAAGRHNIMLHGPPGTGKTMLAKAFRHILPKLTYQEMLEVTAIHSAAGTLAESEQPFIVYPPIRQPHHLSSASAILGGTGAMRPGEITLAHKGVLFMDEFPEFNRQVIESLRQPMEERVVFISRVKGAVLFPADFILLATMNPCPCGNYSSTEKICSCGMGELNAYRKKISDPIADRIDLWVKVESIRSEKASGIEKNSTTKKELLITETQCMREKIFTARAVQRQRFESLRRADLSSKASANSDMTVRDIKKIIPLSRAVQNLLSRAGNQLSLSMRGHYRLIKISRTIADLDNATEIEEKHLLEALQYRPHLRE